MGEINMQMQELVRAIRKSSDYTQYQILYEEIKKDQELFGRVNDYRRSRFVLEMKEDEDLIGKMNQLKWDYSDILNKSLVKEFLSAEQRYVKLFRQIQDTVTEAMNLDIGFLE